MSNLEETVRTVVNAEEWIKLKKFDEHQIVVCIYHPMTEERKKFVVQAYRGLEEDILFEPHVRVQSLAFTERKFKRKDKKIAKWYFKELCKLFKHGILVNEGMNRQPSGRWDRR